MCFAPTAAFRCQALCWLNSFLFLDQHWHQRRTDIPCLYNAESCAYRSLPWFMSTNENLFFIFANFNCFHVIFRFRVHLRLKMAEENYWKRRVQWSASITVKQKKTVNTWKISGMLIVYWPITIKFRIRKQTSIPLLFVV